MKQLLSLIVLLGLANLNAQEIPNLSTRRDLWPREVSLTAPVKVPLIVDGKNIGSAELPAGTTLPVSEINGADVRLNYNGSPLVVPSKNTDLHVRVQRVLKQREIMAASAPTPATAPAAPAPPVASSSEIAKELKGSLVSLQNGRVANFDDAKLSKVKYYAFYYSASWCPPCRKFTPSLVEFYNSFKPQHPEFEIILVGRDRTEADSNKYIESHSMPWPALRVSEEKNKTKIMGYMGQGIPCLVLVDSDGNVLSDSYVDGKYVGPDKVMRDIKAKFGTK
jgi:nucleoredoxin